MVLGEPTPGGRMSSKSSESKPDTHIYLCMSANLLGFLKALQAQRVTQVFHVLPAARVHGEQTPGAADLHRHGGRAHPEAPRLLPGPSHHGQDRHHHQLREDHWQHQSAGDPPGTQKQHEGNVSRFLFVSKVEVDLAGTEVLALWKGVT